MIGIKQLRDWWFDIQGWNFVKDLFENRVIRMEYDAVIPMESTIIIDKIKFRLEVSINSIITSFEKKPDINGIPIRAILLIPRIDNIKG